MKKIIIGNQDLPVEKLVECGFEYIDDDLILKRNIVDSQLCAVLKHVNKNNFTLLVIDNTTCDEYVLHNVPSAKGEYVGRVRSEIDSMMSEIEEMLLEKAPFKAVAVTDIIEHIGVTYGSFPEFLWAADPNCAVFRRRDTGKWFGVLMRVPLSKLGLDTSECCEILNLHVDSESIDDIVDKKQFFYAFHMNKRHWVSALIDENYDFDLIRAMISKSYELARKK